MPVRILFIGDVVGSPGRRGLAATMPQLRETHGPDLVIVNGENSAGGIGITEKTAGEIFAAGADVITTGNHVYRHRDVYSYLDRERAPAPPRQLPAGESRPWPHRRREPRRQARRSSTCSGAAGLPGGAVARSPRRTRSSNPWTPTSWSSTSTPR